MIERVRVKKRGIKKAGNGLFASEFGLTKHGGRTKRGCKPVVLFEKDDFITSYTGDHLTKAPLDRRYPGDIDVQYGFQIGPDHYIDARESTSCFGRYANSHKGVTKYPNAYLGVRGGRGGVFAEKRIHQGEEILVSYGEGPGLGYEDRKGKDDPEIDDDKDPDYEDPKKKKGKTKKKGVKPLPPRPPPSPDNHPPPYRDRWLYVRSTSEVFHMLTPTKDSNCYTTVYDRLEDCRHLLGDERHDIDIEQETIINNFGRSGYVEFYHPVNTPVPRTRIPPPGVKFRGYTGQTSPLPSPPPTPPTLAPPSPPKSTMISDDDNNHYLWDAYEKWGKTQDGRYVYNTTMHGTSPHLIIYDIEDGDRLPSYVDMKLLRIIHSTPREMRDMAISEGGNVGYGGAGSSSSSRRPSSPETSGPFLDDWRRTTKGEIWHLVKKTPTSNITVTVYDKGRTIPRGATIEDLPLDSEGFLKRGEASFYYKGKYVFPSDIPGVGELFQSSSSSAPKPVGVSLSRPQSTPKPPPKTSPPPPKPTPKPPPKTSPPPPKTTIRPLVKLVRLEGRQRNNLTPKVNQKRNDQVMTDGDLSISQTLWGLSKL
jgi:hypothetical protein